MAETATANTEAIETAANRVLGIYELFKMILLDADTTTLAIARRINRYTRGVIEDAKELQRNLFVLPSNDQKRFLNAPDDEAGPYAVTTVANRKLCRQRKQLLIVKVHPLLSSFIRLDKEHGFLEFRISSAKMLQLQAGPWQDLFICQPPVTKLFVVYSHVGRGPRGEREAFYYDRTVIDQEGIKFKTIAEHMLYITKWNLQGQPELNRGELRKLEAGVGTDGDEGGAPARSLLRLHTEEWDRRLRNVDGFVHHFAIAGCVADDLVPTLTAVRRVAAEEVAKDD